MRNIVTICLDSVRKDYFDEHATRIQSRSDISFSQCRSPSSWSPPSHGSLFSGQLPSEHGVHQPRETIDFSLIKNSTFFSEYHSACISSNPYLCTDFNANDLFDTLVDLAAARRYLYPETSVPDFQESGLNKYLGFLSDSLHSDDPIKNILNGLVFKLNNSRYIPRIDDKGAKRICSEVKNEFRQLRDPYFMYLNFMDAHGPYATLRHYNDQLHDVPHSWHSRDQNRWDLMLQNEIKTEYLENLRDCYIASIDYLDRQISSLIDDLLNTSGGDLTIIVLADHGQSLGFKSDYGLLANTSSLSEGLLHVPFEVINPPSEFTVPPSTRDLMISSMELGNLISDINEEGSFNPPDEPPVAEVIGAGLKLDEDMSEDDKQHHNRMIRAGYTDSTTKIEWDSLGGCYEITTDPKRPCWQTENNPIASPPASLVQRFSTDIETYKQQAEDGSEKGNLSSEREEILESLGYI